MPADPAAVPPPEWAVEMANTVGDCGAYHDFNGSCCVDIVNRIARLLASVCERKVEDCRRVAAEFSDYCDAVSKGFAAKGDWVNAESWRMMGRGAFLLRTARLDALLHTPPSGGGA